MHNSLNRAGSLINPRPSRGHGVIVVCLSVCLSVTSESGQLSVIALHLQRPQIDMQIHTHMHALYHVYMRKRGIR